MLIKYNLLELRKQKKLTQRQLSKRSGVSPAMISFIERGKRHPTFDTLILLTMGLGVKLSELVSIGEDPNFIQQYF